MISTIILAGGADRDLASLLSALVPAAVDGLVRDVVVVAGTPDQARRSAEAQNPGYKAQAVRRA